MGVGVPNSHEDFEARMQGGGGGRGKQLAIHLEALLVDEVSMLAGASLSLGLPKSALHPRPILAAEFIDLLDEQLRKLVKRYGRGVENTHRGAKLGEIPPFGGVQLILCGDFFQLPPIVGKVPLLDLAPPS